MDQSDLAPLDPEQLRRLRDKAIARRWIQLRQAQAQPPHPLQPDLSPIPSDVRPTKTAP